MRRLPLILIIVMFIEIGLDLMGTVGGAISPRAMSMSPALLRLLLATVFTAFAFKRQTWALIAMAVLEGITASACLVISIMFFLSKSEFRFAASLLLVAGLLIGAATIAFARCAIRWRQEPAPA